MGHSPLTRLTCKLMGRAGLPCIDWPDSTRFLSGPYWPDTLARNGRVNIMGHLWAKLKASSFKLIIHLQLSVSHI